MDFDFVKSGVFSLKTSICDCDENAKSIKIAISNAKSQGVEVLCFPELCLTGASAGDTFYLDVLLKSATDNLIEIASFTKGVKMLIAVGLPLKVDGKLYNAVAVINDGNILGVVPKSVLSTTCVDDKRYFCSFNSVNTIITIGKEQVPFGNDLIFTSTTNPLIKVGVVVGDEILSPYSKIKDYTSMGVKLILNPNCAEQIVGNFDKIEKTISAYSSATNCAVLSAFSGEGESTAECVIGGNSFIIENGKTLVKSELFSTDLYTSEIDIGYLNYKSERQLNDVWEKDFDRIDFVHETDAKITRFYTKTPFIPDGEMQRKERAEYILSVQTEALRKRIVHTHSNGVVVGLSGGLDSTLAIIVAVKAILKADKTTKDVLAVTMPCFGTTSRTLDNSVQLAKALGVKLKKVDISKAVTRHLKDISHDINIKDVTYENAQARERTQVLMDIANQSNALVIGTGDLSEVALGWSTYNGDHMSMYGVNCTIPKTLVRHLVDYVADSSRGKLKAVLKDILDTPVSPELLPPTEGKIAQKTEDIVGPYILHDYFLYGMIKKGWAPKKIFELASITFKGEFDSQTILKWLKTFIRRFFMQQFKRSCTPDGVKVGSVGLSPRGAFMMPSDVTSNIWLKELENM